MSEGLEKVSFLLLRYDLVERIYVPKATRVKDLLKDSIIKLYASILLYIVKAHKYYSQSTAQKFGKSFIEGRSRVQKLLDQVSTMEADVDSIRRDVDAECQ